MRRARTAAEPPEPDHAWKLLELVNSWIRQADTKAAAALTGAGLIGGTLYNLVHGLDPQALTLPIDIAAVVCAASAAGAAAAAATALLPRLTLPRSRRSGPPIEQVSPLYFRHISAHHADPDEYRAVVGALLRDRSALADEVAGQVWVNSRIANRKYVWANRAIVGFLTALGTLGLLALLVART